MRAPRRCRGSRQNTARRRGRIVRAHISRLVRAISGRATVVLLLQRNAAVDKSVRVCLYYDCSTRRFSLLPGTRRRLNAHVKTQQ